MNSIAFRALPVTVFQRQVVVNEATNMTPFCRRKEPVNFMYLATVPFTFVFEHIDKRIPSSIGDRLSKTVVLDHVPNGETFYMNRLVIADKLFACLMQKVASLIGYPFMLEGKFANSAFARIRIFNFSGYTSLEMLKSLLRQTKELWAINDFTIGGSNERLDTEVQPNFATLENRVRDFSLAQYRSEVFTSSSSGNSDRLHRSFNRTVYFYSNAFSPRDVELAIYQRPTLRYRERLSISPALELGELSAFIEKVIIQNRVRKLPALAGR